MYHISIVFGHDDRDGEPIPEDDAEAAQDMALEIFAEFFEGGYSYTCIGVFKSPAGSVIEPCTWITASASDLDEDCKAELVTLARALGIFLKQKCVLLEWYRVDGQLCFVEPDEPTSEEDHQAA